MSYKKVLLVNPQYNAEWKGVTPPIGQGYLAETLAQQGVEYDVIDMNLGYTLKHLFNKIDEFQPDLIGYSMITRNFYAFYEQLEKIKQHAPGITTIAGGPHVTIMREKVLQSCSALDIGCVHEGERTLVELCQSDLPLAEIKGLLYRDGDQICYSGDRPYVDDIDTIPWPRFEKYELHKYFKEVNIFSSRGCPFHCIFCARPVISECFRKRSAANVVDEIEYWYRKGYRNFNFEDDNFNLIKERVYQICDEIEQRGMNDLLIRCSNGIRADRADRAVLARMREVGFRYLAIGVDAGNDRMLKVVKKGETMEQIENTIQNACDLGYDIKLFFVFGNPTETPQDVRDMAAIALRYPISEVHFNNIIPYPGTELYDWVVKHGGFLAEPDVFLNDAAFMDDEPVFETPELPKEEKVKLKKYLDGVRGRIHRRSIRRIFPNPFIGFCASVLVSSRYIEQLYYTNSSVRGVVEHFRYKKSELSGLEVAK